MAAERGHLDAEYKVELLILFFYVFFFFLFCLFLFCCIVEYFFVDFALISLMKRERLYYEREREREREIIL